MQVEDTKLVSKMLDNNEENEIEIMVEPKEGQDIRPIGCDIKEGTLVLNKGTKIGSVEIGLLASCGCKQVSVTKLPSVGILSTGDELQEPSESLKVGHVYDSNKLSLITLLRENGFDNVEDFGIVGDE